MNPLLISCLALVGLGALGFVGLTTADTTVEKIIDLTPKKIVRSVPTPTSSLDGGHDDRRAKPAAMGDPVSDQKLTFTVTKVAPGPETISRDGLSKTAQGKFVFVYVTVANHGDVAQTFSGDDQRLESGGDDYPADPEAAVYLPPSQSPWKQVDPGNSVRGIVIFDIPTDVEPTAVVLHESRYSDGVRVPLK